MNKTIGRTIIRQATKDDIDFIIETIIEAEKSGTDKISFCNIFAMTEVEVYQLLRNMLLKDIRNQEINISDYLICEIDGEYAAACTSWIEEIDGDSAAILKASLLFDYVPREKLLHGQRNFSLIQGLNIEREPGTLQIANCYTKREYRGLGLIGKLMNEHIKSQLEAHPNLKKVQVRPTLTNPRASKAYEKIGFVKVFESTVNDNEILKILPAKTKILMEKILDKQNFLRTEGEILFRPANENDVDFVARTIIEAEKSGTDKMFTSNLIGVSENEFFRIIKDILLKNFENCEYSLSRFLIAECDSIPVGAMVSWIEGITGLPSSIVKTTMLLEYLEVKNRERMQRLLKLMINFGIKRTPGTLQIEYFYVIESSRGKRIISKLIIQSIKNHLIQDPLLERVEVILMKDNANSFKALERLGFKICNEIYITEEEIKNIFPYDTILQMYMGKEDFLKLIK